MDVLYSNFIYLNNRAISLFGNDNTKLSVSYSSFINDTTSIANKEGGGAIFMQNGASSVLYSNNFIMCSEPFYGAHNFRIIFTGPKIFCQNLFDRAGRKGTAAVFVIDYSDVIYQSNNISRCEIDKACMHTFNNNITLSYSYFTDSHSYGYVAFTFLQCTAIMKFCIIVNNLVDSPNQLIEANEAHLTLLKCTFKQNRADCFLKPTTGKVYIYSCSIDLSLNCGSTISLQNPPNYQGVEINYQTPNQFVTCNIRSASRVQIYILIVSILLDMS